MLKHRATDLICASAICLAVAVTVLFMFGEHLGLHKSTDHPPYQEKLFDDSAVHAIDIQIEPDVWQGMLDSAQDEEYVICDIVIDGERIENVGLRPKGNNSLNLIEHYDSDRYSLKIEFDHVSSGLSYHGLDKLSLNASFQDNAYMKDYFTYDMMRRMGVPTPLCSYAWVTVNGEDRGLFLAVEEIERAFARRNFGSNHGLLYKPDYMRLEDENSDVALIYTGDDPDRYPNIFREAKFRTSSADERRLIEALRVLDTGENLEEAVDVDRTLRYFTVQSFVVNLDSYLGKTGHNYYLYEEEGRISMLPWDYNLAFGTYALGSDYPDRDAETFVNFPINTPAPGEYMLRRPLYHNLMRRDAYFGEYHRHYDTLISEYFESGLFEEKLGQTAAMIAPYVERDPTKFCTYEDHLLAVETFRAFCLLRAESVRGQLDGSIPATIKGQRQDRLSRVDASHIQIADLGDLEDM